MLCTWHQIQCSYNTGRDLFYTSVRAKIMYVFFMWLSLTR
jgi:hypothetical protein